MSHEQKLKGGSSSLIAANIPAPKEIWFNTTTNRLHGGNGVTPGGIIIPNAADALNNPFTYGNAGGTGAAITLTLSPVPAAYTAGMKVLFKAANNNPAGGTTLNVNGLGAKNILKMVAGALVALDAADIVATGLYEATYDGTQFQLASVAPPVVGQNHVDPLDIQSVSGAAQMDFTTGFGSDYFGYELDLASIALSSTTASLLLRFSTGSFHTGASDYTYEGSRVTSGAISYFNSPNASSITLVPNTSTAGRISGKLHIIANAGDLPSVGGTLRKTPNATAAASHTITIGGGLQASNSQVLGIRLLPSGGTISGVGKLVGIRDTI